ncbi:hypothetical protein V8C86DRAFT_798750 [Haematococcus lacustris]
MTTRAIADDRVLKGTSRFERNPLQWTPLGSVHALGRRHAEPCKERPASTTPKGQPLDAATAAQPTTRPYGPASRHKPTEPLVPRNLAGCYPSTAVPAAPAVPPPPKPTSHTHRAVSAVTKVPIGAVPQPAAGATLGQAGCSVQPTAGAKNSKRTGSGTRVLHAVHGQVPMDRDVAGPLPAPGPAAGPVSLTAAARGGAAGNRVDPLPNVSWGRYLLKSNVPDNGQTGNTDTRCFELLYKPIVQALGLDLEAGVGVDIRVTLALEEQWEDPTKHANLACGGLQLLCVAKPNSKKTKWRFNTAHMKKKVRDWVKSVGKQLTGRFKAIPKQHGPHLLVLEVRPLPKAGCATSQAGCATSGQC